MRSLFVGMVTGIAAFVLAQSSQGQEDKGVANSKKILTTFWSKVEANDLDGVLSASKLPFCWNDGDPDRVVGKIVRDRENLKKLLKELIAGLKGKKAQLKIVESFSYAQFLKVTGDLLAKDGLLKKDREILDEVMRENGYVLMTKISASQEALCLWDF